MKKLVAMLCALTLSGCAIKAPHLTRKEWIEVTTREYTGVSNDQVLDASEELFRLADGDDFNISHSQDGLYASRNWMVYVVFTAVMGTDYWLVKTTPTPNGIKVSVQVNTQAGAITPMATTGGDLTATSTTLGGMPIDGKAIYDVFWARMDYLLGKRSNWMTCKEANDRVNKHIVWGSNDALCNAFNVKDQTPKAPLIAP